MSQEFKFKIGDVVLCTADIKVGFGGIKKVRGIQSGEFPYLVENSQVAYTADELELVNPPEVEATPDIVNHPEHYTQGGMELIDVMFAKMGKTATNDYMWGAIIKYIFRFKHKNGVQDLMKARWYLNKLIESMEDEQHVD